MRSEEVTQLLKRLGEGDSSAGDELYPIVYPELKRIARRQLSKERINHSLQPTALLHEVYVKLTEGRPAEFASRDHFYAFCARMMRNILVSHARSKQAIKRGGGAAAFDLDQLSDISQAPEYILVALDRALECLEKESPRAYRLVELRFFAGFDFEEAAKILGVSSRTLKRDWEAAKLWLYRELRDSKAED